MKKTEETGKVMALASNGQGIIRKEGLVTFIPFVAQGDLVQYEIVKQKKNFAIGSLLEVLEPGQERVSPRCPYYGTCGGCQLQHISYASQLQHKRTWVEDALRKIGHFPEIKVPPVRPAHSQWEYRRRISLVLKKQTVGFLPGYIGIDHHSLVPVGSCVIFTEPNDPIFAAIQEICRCLDSENADDAKATILKYDADSCRYLIHFHFKKMPRNADNVLSHAIKDHPCIIGILATAPGQSLQFGTLIASCQIGQLSCTFTPLTFIQNHPEQSLNIYKAIESVGKELKPKSVLDLYCGIGISSMLLAHSGARVTGVELNPESVRLAQSNAENNRIKNTKFIVGDVEKVLKQLLQQAPLDLIIVNPPREGLAPQVTKLLAEQPAQQLLYISCMPSTLARDLQLLCKNEYQLSSVKAFDMFPQTVHVETLAACSRSTKS